MSGIKPEQFDYNAAVDKADAEKFDWGALYQSTQDPGFSQLSDVERKHIWDLLRVKSEREHGNRVDPYAPTGELSALRQLGNALKAVISIATPTEPGVLQGHIADMKKSDEVAAAAFSAEGYSKEQAEKARQEEVQQAGKNVIQQFGHYLTGGLVPEPEQNEDAYVKDIMDGVVKPATSLAAIGTQIATGSFLLSLVSKVPLVSAAAENLSVFTRGMIKGGLLDFGINAAWPEGLAMQDRFGISDDIGRFIAPQSVRDNPAGPMGRLVAGVGGAAEGALLGSALYGFSTGITLADAKYAFSVKPEMMERVKESLKLAGVDITGMSRKDIMLNYRTRMTQHIQGLSEAGFNGERQSAEAWIAQAFLSDPNITELTPAEGRLLYGVFSTNKGGVSLIKGVTDPEAALLKLRKVGIDVDATVLPRPNPAGAGVSSGDVPVPATDAELDAAVELSDEVGAKNAQTPAATKEGLRKELDQFAVDDAIDTAAEETKIQKEIDELREQAKTMEAGNARAAELQAQEWEKLLPSRQVDELTGKPVTPKEPIMTIKRKRPSKKDLKVAEDRAVKAERRADEAERKAQVDGLTGVNNQGSWKAAQKRIDADPNLEVVSIDLANFKVLNDKAGHEAGDQILQGVAASLKTSIADLGDGAQVFRTGGDEFVLVTPKGKGQETFDKAKKMFGSHLVVMRGGIGSTYKEADAAERALRETSKQLAGDGSVEKLFKYLAIGDDGQFGKTQAQKVYSSLVNSGRAEEVSHLLNDPKFKYSRVNIPEGVEEEYIARMEGLRKGHRTLGAVDKDAETIKDIARRDAHGEETIDKLWKDFSVEERKRRWGLDDINARREKFTDIPIEIRKQIAKRTKK